MINDTTVAALAIILLSTGALTACDGGNSSAGMLEDYLTRIENATGVERPGGEPITLLPYPRRRDRSIPVEEMRIGIADFIHLYDCELFRLINERNSNLGRIMPISRRLVYEITFLDSASDCQRKLAADPSVEFEFRDRLSKIIETKRAHLPRIVWNATFDSDEMHKAFSLAVAPLDLDEGAVYVNSRQVIDYFNGLSANLAQPRAAIDMDRLEDHYFTLQLHQFGGRLAQSVAQLTRYLDDASHSLETAVKDPTLCFQNKPTKKARILETVLRKFYGGRVQPYLAGTYQHGKNWLLAINRLIESQAVRIPDAFRRYRSRMLALEGQESLWFQFEAAIGRHTMAWQGILDQCGLTLEPGG